MYYLPGYWTVSILPPSWLCCSAGKQVVIEESISTHSLAARPKSTFWTFQFKTEPFINLSFPVIQSKPRHLADTYNIFLSFGVWFFILNKSKAVKGGSFEQMVEEDSVNPSRIFCTQKSQPLAAFLPSWRRVRKQLRGVNFVGGK